MRIAAFLLVLFSVVSATAQSTESQDFQFWSDTQVTVPLIKSEDKKSDRLSLILTGTLRAGRNLGGLVDERIAVGVEYRFNSNVSITPAYVYRAEQAARGRTQYESRFRVDLQLEKKFSRFTLKDRNRVEHRFRNSRSDITRYRNKFQILVPVTKDKKELFAPFVAVEPFYEFQSKHWTRIETSVGISKKFSPAVGLDVYYLLQNNRGPVLKLVNTIGVNLKFRIE